jgi:exopolysaccharide biosynthesis protein
MKKSTLFFFLVLVLFVSCSSQEFLNHEQSRKIHPHIEWRSIQKELNGAPASVNILNIDIRRFEGDLLLSWYSDTLVKTSDIAKSEAALAAVNGSFFDMRAGGSVVFLQENGNVITETQDRSAFINEGAYALDTAGVVMILKKPENDDWGYSPAHRDILVSGPLLIHNHERTSPQPIPFNLRRHPRTAIGISESGHFLLVTVDGRHTEAAGMNIWELQELMESLGCKDALNLDGGGSTTLYIRGKGVVNYPSDNRTFDHEGERRVSNAILVMP